MKTIQVGSSHGSLTCNKETGMVIECSLFHGENENERIAQIAKFDLEEWKKCYVGESLPDYLDILDLGYWTKNGEYEQPVIDWRNEYRLNN